MVRGHGQEAKRGEAGGQRIPRNCEVLGTFLRTCATTEFSLIAMWRLIGATPRGQPWTPAVTLLQGRDGLSARRMAVLWTFRAPSLCRHVPHELMRNAALNLTLIIPATACHQRNYVERYSRSNKKSNLAVPCTAPRPVGNLWLSVQQCLRHLPPVVGQLLHDGFVEPEMQSR